MEHEAGILDVPRSVKAEKIDVVIYEGAMCCLSGVCGPEPDADLIEFGKTLKSLGAEFENASITRAGITFDFNRFLENREVFNMVKEEGQGVLPVTAINGKIVSKGRYLKYVELKKLIGDNNA